MDTDELFRQANAAYEKGDFTEAFAIFTHAANGGDCHAMTRLATMYELGEGVPADLSKSIEWDLKAIAAGSRSSILNLGLTYRSLGKNGDAQKWFEKALEQGDGEAAFELAKLYKLEDENSPLIKKYLLLAVSAGDLSEETAKEVQNWLAKIG
ncbi:hypothetical protein GCM10027277_33540 [Pseudoduganella ginsengisoli]|uniref:Tetratricopeptide repeat protein n=1 Tax=Pseudoduganella ginsengisoli TaxID=1462440 RepID=A0A6L6Q7Z8_9BURK|nr:tetratricopeptide repeat protein [Pseudoduganella ginsengisoli]MTW05338.1 tetratricopeptide repeat protein [Pseudoduganella ginsengisoli]